MYQQLSHTSEVSSETYLALVWDQNGLSHRARMWLQKFSTVSAIVIHNIIYITWYNYCRVNKGTKDIIFIRYLPLSLSHTILIFPDSLGSQPAWRGCIFLPILKALFFFNYTYGVLVLYVSRGQSQDSSESWKTPCVAFRKLFIIRAWASIYKKRGLTQLLMMMILLLTHNYLSHKKTGRVN